MGITNKEAQNNMLTGYDRFIKATVGSNKLVNMVLRNHLLAEYYVDKLLLASMDRADILLSDNRTTFSYKLTLLKSLNLFSQNAIHLIDSLKGLNSVRNACSHTLDYQITASDIDKIGKPFGPQYIELTDKYSKNLEQHLAHTLITLIGQLDGFSSSKSKK